MVSALAWSNGYDVRFTRERFRVRSSVRVFVSTIPLHYYGPPMATCVSTMLRLQRRYSSVVERALRKRTVVGSIPTGGFWTLSFLLRMLDRPPAVSSLSYVAGSWRYAGVVRVY